MYHDLHFVTDFCELIFHVERLERSRDRFDGRWRAIEYNNNDPHDEGEENCKRCGKEHPLQEGDVILIRECDLTNQQRPY